MKKIRPAAVILAAALLVAAAAAAVHIASRPETEEGALLVVSGGSEQQIVLSDLPLQHVQGTLTDGKGEKKDIEGQGIPAEELLEQAGVSRYSRMKVTASDEYSAEVTAEEAADTGRVFFLLQEDSSVRLVVFGDENSRRSVSDVQVVEVS